MIKRGIQYSYKHELHYKKINDYRGPGDTEATSYDVKELAEWEEMDTI